MESVQSGVPVTPQRGAPIQQDSHNHIRDLVRRFLPSEETVRSWVFSDATDVARDVAAAAARKEISSQGSKHLYDALPSALDNIFPEWFASWGRGNLARFAEAERTSMRRQLSREIDDRISTLVSSDAYHAVSKPYFEAFRSKSNTALAEFRSAAEKEVSNIEQRVTHQMKRVDEAVDARMQKHIGGLEREVSVWRWMCFVSFVASVATALKVFGWKALEDSWK